MTTRIRPAIPDPSPDAPGLQQAVIALKHAVEVLLNAKNLAAKGNAAVTWQDMVNLGIVRPSDFTVPGTALPAKGILVVADMGSTQTVTTSTSTKVNLDTKIIDVENAFDFTNHRYQPQIAGTYLIVGAISSNSDDGTYTAVSLSKNGAIFAAYSRMAGGSGAQDLIITAPVDLNGTTDYVELNGLSGSAASPAFNTQSSVGVASAHNFTATRMS